MTKVVYAKAEWWERPEARPTQPGIQRDRLPSPSQPPSPSRPQPSPTNSLPTGGLPSVTPVQTPSNGGATIEDPCTSGKSYVGSYCGWSPAIGGDSGGGRESARIGGPEVKGLSYTSGDSLTLSDIMLLAGVLCLLLYTRSKTRKVSI